MKLMLLVIDNIAVISNVLVVASFYLARYVSRNNALIPLPGGIQILLTNPMICFM